MSPPSELGHNPWAVTAGARENNRFVRTALYAAVAVPAFVLFYRQGSNPAFPSDLTLHLSIIDAFIGGHYTIPHPAFHLLVYAGSAVSRVSYALSAAAILSAAVVISVEATRRVIRGLVSDGDASWPILALAILVNFATAIYVPFFNRNIYLGQWSPNIWHNPQLILVKPLALIAFALYVRMLGSAGRGRPDLWFAVAFLAGVVTKPSFAFVFLPAAGLYLLAFHSRSRDLWRRTILATLPSVIVMALQYIVTYRLSAGDSHYHDRIVFTWLGVLRLYTPSVPISALLVLAFPLAVTLLGGAATRTSVPLRLAWLFTAVSFVQTAFLAEELKFRQAAFAFGYDISLFVLYVTAIAEWLRWRAREPGVSAGQSYAAGAVFALHVVSGLFYFGRLLQGGSYN